MSFNPSDDLSAWREADIRLRSGWRALHTSKDAELNQLRTQVKTLQAAAPSPKKIVVDDNEPKKPAPKKKTIPRPPAKQSDTPAQPAPPSGQPK
jgi:hypothetical protein